MTRSRPPTSVRLDRLERHRRSSAAFLATLFLTCSYVPGAMVVAAPQIFARVGPGVSNLPLQATAFSDPSFGEINDAVNIASGNAYVDLGQLNRNNSTNTTPGNAGGSPTNNTTATSGTFNVSGIRRLAGFNTYNPTQPAEWSLGTGDGGSQIFRRTIQNGTQAFCTDNRSDVVGFKKYGTGTNSTEIHTLNGGANFQNFLYQTGTGQGQDPNKIYKMVNWDNDGRPDLVQINQGNSNGKVELHVFSAASNFQSRIFDTVTLLGPIGDNWDFNIFDWNQDGKLDLVGSLKSHTGTNSVEIHVLNGTDNFQSYLDQRGTSMPIQPNTTQIRFADWDRDNRPDLIGINTQNTGTGKTEIHILSAASGFRQSILDIAAGTGYLSNNTEVDITDWDKDGYPDLLYVIKNATGTQKTEIHVYSGSSNFQNPIVQVGTALEMVSNDQWSFTTTDYPDYCGAMGYDFNQAPTWIKERYAELGSQVSYYTSKPQAGQSNEETWLVTYRLPNGRQIAHYYDQEGNRTSFYGDGEYADYAQTPHEQYRSTKYRSDPNGFGGDSPKTEFTYTGFNNGRIKKVRDSWGRATTYEWDENLGTINNINLLLQDENNNSSWRKRVEYLYNVVNNQRVVSYMVFRTYDAHNQSIGRWFSLEYKVAANGEVLLEKLGRPVLMDGSEAGGRGPGKFTKYAYDSFNRIQSTSTLGEPDTRFTYANRINSNGFQVTQSQWVGNDRRETIYYFTPEGWLESKQLYEWNPDNRVRREHNYYYTYNANGQVTSLLNPSGANYHYSYDGRGNRTRETVYLTYRSWKDSVDADQVRTTRYFYDRDNRLTKEILENRSGKGLSGSQQTENSYSYGNNERRIEYSMFGESLSGGQRATAMEKQEEKRFIDGNERRKFTSTFDESGRLAQTDLYRAGDNLAYKTIKFGFWSASATNSRIISPSTDGNGTWNSERLVRSYADLVSIKETKGFGVNNIISYYHYDEYGNISWKVDEDAYIGSWSGEESKARLRETITTYDGFGNLVWERILSQRGGQDYNWFESNKTWTYYATGEIKASSIGYTGDNQDVRSVTAYGYDTNSQSLDYGRVLTIKVGEGNNAEVSKVHQLTELEYDYFGRLASRTIDGAKSKFTYDTLDRVVATKNQDGSYQKLRYWEGLNSVHEQIDYNVNQEELTTWREFDALGRQYYIGFPQDSGNIRTFYDAFDRPIKITDNRLTMNSGDTDRSTYLKYDTAGNLTEKLDPSLVTGSGQAYTDNRRPFKQYTYDVLDREIRQETLLYGGTVQPTNLSFPSNSAKAASTKEYDSLNRVIKFIDPDSYVTTMEYDNDNNIVSTKKQVWKDSDKDKSIVAYKFDYVITRTAYNAIGQPVQKVDGRGNSQKIIYNVQGNPITQINEKDVTIRKYGYTADGLLQSISVPDNDVNSSTMQTIEYREYDGRTLPSKVYIAHMNNLAGPGSGSLTTYKYLNEINKPRKTQITLPPVTGSTSQTIEEEYDNLGNLLSRTDEEGFKTQYAYDWRGLLIRKDELARPGNAIDNGAQLNGGLHSNFKYNSSGNLSYKQENGLITEYQYNSMGKIIRESRPRNGDATPTNWKLTTYRLDSLPTAQTSYTYNGNLTSRVDVVVFDVSSNPPSVTSGNIVLFEYDGRGNLWGKQSRGVGRNTNGTSSGVRTEYNQWQYTNGLNQTYKRVFEGSPDIYVEQREDSGLKLEHSNVLTFWRYDENGNLTTKWDTPMGGEWNPRKTSDGRDDIQNAFIYTYTKTNKEDTSLRDVSVRVRRENNLNYRELAIQGGNTGILLAGTGAKTNASYNERDQLTTYVAEDLVPTSYPERDGCAPPSQGCGGVSLPNRHYNYSESIKRTTNYSYYLSGQRLNSNVEGVGFRRIDEYDQRGRELKIYDSNGPTQSGNSLDAGIATTIVKSYSSGEEKTVYKQYDTDKKTNTTTRTLGGRVAKYNNTVYTYDPLLGLTKTISQTDSSDVTTLSYDNYGNQSLSTVTNSGGGRIETATYYDNDNFETGSGFANTYPNISYQLDSRGNRLSQEYANGYGNILDSGMTKRYNPEGQVAAYFKVGVSYFCGDFGCSSNGISNRYNDFRYDPYGQQILAGTGEVQEGGNDEYRISRIIRSTFLLDGEVQYVFGKGTANDNTFFHWKTSGNNSHRGEWDSYGPSQPIIKDQSYSLADGLNDTNVWNGTRIFNVAKIDVTPLDAPIKPLSSILKINPLEVQNPGLPRLPDPSKIISPDSVQQQDKLPVVAPEKTKSDNSIVIPTRDSSQVSVRTLGTGAALAYGEGGGTVTEAVYNEQVSQGNTLGSISDSEYSDYAAKDHYISNDTHVLPNTTSRRYDLYSPTDDSTISSNDFGVNYFDTKNRTSLTDARARAIIDSPTMTDKDKRAYLEGLGFEIPKDYLASVCGVKCEESMSGDIFLLPPGVVLKPSADYRVRRYINGSAAIIIDGSVAITIGDVPGGPPRLPTMRDIEAGLESWATYPPSLGGWGGEAGLFVLGGLKLSKYATPVTQLISRVCSFDYKTPVRTIAGLTEIGKLTVGTPVLAYNEETGENGYYPITAVHLNVDPAITYLTVKDPEQADKAELITTTPEHPFYLTAPINTQPRPKPQGHDDLSTRWVGAGHLKIGDQIKQADGTTGTVTKVVTVQQTQEMFNLTVNGAHTFYVGQDGWLVHNAQQSQVILYRAVSEGEYQSIVRKGAFTLIHGKGLIVKEFTTSYEAAVEFGKNMGKIGGEPYTRIVATIVKNPNSLSMHIGEAADLTGRKLPFYAFEANVLRTLKPITDLEEILKLVPC